MDTGDTPPVSFVLPKETAPRPVEAKSALGHHLTRVSSGCGVNSTFAQDCWCLCERGPALRRPPVRSHATKKLCALGCKTHLTFSCHPLPLPCLADGSCLRTAEWGGPYGFYGVFPMDRHPRRVFGGPPVNKRADAQAGPSSISFRLLLRFSTRGTAAIGQPPAVLPLTDVTSPCG